MTNDKSESNVAKDQINNTSDACGAELPQKQISKEQKKEQAKAKSKAVRQELRSKSQEAKAIRERMNNEAKTAAEAVAAAGLTLNSIIVEMYQNETTCKQFNTFHDWKKAGYKVNTGVKGFAVWGKPKRVKDTMKTEEGEVLEGESWEFWPLCYLFNESQVTKIGDLEPSKEDDKPETAPETSPSEPVKAEKTVIDPVVAIEENSPQEAVIDSPFVMVDYEDHKEARRERLEERAENKRKESDQAFKRSHDLVDHIPMGQPILVGHHSERAHRNALDKSWNALGKSVKLDKYADSLESRAASVGTGGISSNDPEALTKLKEELANLQKSQEIMKAVNKILKTKQSDADKKSQIIKDGLLGERLADQIMTRDHAGRAGFASYSLSNNNANIRRIKQRIEELEKLHKSDPIDFDNDDFSMAINDGRIVIDFKGGKPNDDTRTIVKRAAFKWSRYQSAWVRKVTANAIYSAIRLLEELKQVENMY